MGDFRFTHPRLCSPDDDIRGWLLHRASKQEAVIQSSLRLSAHAGARFGEQLL